MHVYLSVLYNIYMCIQPTLKDGAMTPRYAMSPLPPPLVVTETRLDLAARRPPPQPANKRPAAGLRTRRDPGTEIFYCDESSLAVGTHNRRSSCIN